MNTTDGLDALLNLAFHQPILAYDDYLTGLGNEKPISWMETTMQHHYKLIWAKKNELIKEKLKEKGFGHLVEGIEKRKFPKIIRITQNEWDYIYADNDTDEGAFIVAIKDNFKNDFDNLEPYKITYEFQWQDKFPIIEYKPLHL